MIKLMSVKEYLNQAGKHMDADELTEQAIKSMPISKYQAYKLGAQNMVNACSLDTAVIIENTKKIVKQSYFSCAVMGLAAGVALGVAYVKNKKNKELAEKCANLETQYFERTGEMLNDPEEEATES